MIVLYRIMALAIVLGIIVLVHELGHYIAARLMGVRVETFSFGFGKRLFGKKIGETDFRVSLIPLGGFIKMSGEEEYDKEDIKPYEFQHKNRAQKIFILLMGPLMNLFLAFFILTIINITGVEIEKYKLEVPKIGFVRKDSPAEKAGLKTGDLISKINGRSIPDWKELELTIVSNPNEELTVQYERAGKSMSTKLKVAATDKYNFGYAGFFWDWEPKINAVLKDSPAFKSGLKMGDIIVAINNKNISSFFDVQEVVNNNADKLILFKVKRDNEFIEAEIIPKDVQGRGLIGISCYIPVKELNYGLFGAMGKSTKDIFRLTFLIFDALKKLVAGKLSPKNISGPIEIAEFSQEAIESGLSNFFMLIAFISLNLGIINLFPIPVLDGGHLMIYSIEAVIRKDFSQKIKSILMNIGFVFLISLMIFIILNDVAKKLPNGWNSFLPF